MRVQTQSFPLFLVPCHDLVRPIPPARSCTLLYIIYPRENWFQKRAIHWLKHCCLRSGTL